jgi:hypothetical protein
MVILWPDVESGRDLVELDLDHMYVHSLSGSTCMSYCGESNVLEETRLATVSVPESNFFSAKNKKKSRIFSTEIRRNFFETFLLGQS